MSEIVFDTKNDDADTFIEDGDEVVDPGNANTERKDGDPDDTNADNADAEKN